MDVISYLYVGQGDDWLCSDEEIAADICDGVHECCLRRASEDAEKTAAATAVDKRNEEDEEREERELRQRMELLRSVMNV